MSSEPALSSDPASTGGAGLAVPYGRNAARVLGLLRLAGQDGANRSELALRTGLTPQAVSKITARLRSHGLVTEAGRRASTGGKPSTVLRLAPGARHAVGVQLDRDQLTAVLVDLSGGVVAGRTAPLDMGAGAEGLLDAVESAVNGLIGAGLPALGGRPSGTAPSPEGAAGGELWQQASEGEVWTGRHVGAGGAAGDVPSAEPAAPGADARRAVAEEGELWQDAARSAEAEAEAEAEAGSGAGREAGAGSGAGREAGAEAGPGDETEPASAAESSEVEAGAESGVRSGAEAEPGPREPEPEPEPETGAESGAEARAGAEREWAAGPRPEADEATGPPGAGGRWGTVVGVGVAAPGPLDHVRGVLGHVTGFPQWAGFPLRDALARRLRMPVVVDKDTNAAAMGLALRGKESLAYIHLGTGLGAGLVLDGSIHRGNRNGAGEFGHQVIDLDGPPCRCGRNGCLEALCMDAVRRGRADEAARLLGVGAANLVSLLDVDRVLLGGRTVLADPDTFVDGVAAQLRAAAGAARAGAARLPGASHTPHASDTPHVSHTPHASDAPGPSAAGRTAGAGARDSARGPARVELVPEGSRTVADGAAQLVLAPLFGRAPGTPATAR